MRTSRIAVDAGTAARIEALARMIHRPTADIVRTLSHATLDDFLRLHARRSVREQRGLRETHLRKRPGRRQARAGEGHQGLSNGHHSLRQAFQTFSSSSVGTPVRRQAHHRTRTHWSGCGSIR